MLGKGGDLNVRIDYFRIGDTRVHLRANKGGEGGNTTTTTVVLRVLITPLFLMRHRHEVVFPKGTKNPSGRFCRPLKRRRGAAASRRRGLQ
ncbi:MAG TPA: hypothetical protein VGS12_16350 [Caulobacteraceae bacterium]|nr:hypothetical protein [Caulobacteraceae bacterium]